MATATETTFAAALREEQLRRRSDRLARLAILLPQARMALQVAEGLREGVRQAIGSDHRMVAMTVQVDFATEMLARFVAGCEAEQQSSLPQLLTDADRKLAQEASNRG